MISEEKVRVTNILEKTKDILHLQIDGGCGRAILYRDLHEDVVLGDTVIINTTATELGLGTGGWDIVRAVANRRKKDGLSREKGHIIKARYLGDQHSLLTVEAPESDTHALFHQPLRLKGKKILLCELHSMIPIIWFLRQIKSAETPMSLILSDEAALPLQMSNHLRYLNEQEQFFSITIGQAFGGKKEAINLVTAMQYIMESDKWRDGLVLVSVGPGVVGSGTHYGFTSMAQGEWSNTVGALGGRPVWIPRLSESDERERHRGLSHHTLTPLTELALTDCILPLPTGEKSSFFLEKSRASLSRFSHVKTVGIGEDKLITYLDEIERLAPFPLTTMGRTIGKDLLFFLGVAAAVEWYFDDEQKSKT